MKYIFIIAFLFICTFIQAQNINWQRLETEQRHLVFINTGLDYGVTLGAGYGYHFNTRMPLVAVADFSIPSGSTIFDDFKTRIGAQLRFAKSGDFQLSGRIYGVFRRYQNDFARLLNFGSDMSVAAGYYRKKFFIAAEAGFDKAIVTHFKHSDAYKELFPGVQDGWYDPATGGNFYYGIHTGYSFSKSDLVLRLGSLVEQDFKTKSTLPFYVGIGYVLKFR